MHSKMTLLEKAVVFDLGICKHYNRPVQIQHRVQRDNSALWVVKMHEWVLGKDGRFHWEMQPSNRTDGFIELTRFSTPEEALSFWQSNVIIAHPLQAATWKEFRGEDMMDYSALIEGIRSAFADYRRAEGCACCRDNEAHKIAENKLGELLKAKPYDDGDGFDWSIYYSKKS